jgi:hypothetical protein
VGKGLEMEEKWLEMVEVKLNIVEEGPDSVGKWLEMVRW